MDNYLKIALSALTSFALSMLIAPLLIKLLKKHKAKQTILQYVDNHADKQGTPTMGGFVFLIATAITALSYAGINTKFAPVSVGVMLAFGAVGFLDDFLKIKFKHNLGLKAYQKIIAQLGVTAIITWFAYKNIFIGSTINIPFSSVSIDLKWWYIPLCFIVFLATVNAVNLTDGLDGLAAGVSAVYFGFFVVILCIMLNVESNMGNTLYAAELLSLNIFSAAVFGSLLGFIWHNSNPASVFMGDTGSLALGGAAACVAIFSQNPLLILIIGIMFVVSCISVIIQVIYFKLTKKRVFLMSPFHHHLQYKGYKEQKIVAFYVIITIVCGIIATVSVF